jgi:hypothetical protein
MHKLVSGSLPSGDSFSGSIKGHLIVFIISILSPNFNDVNDGIPPCIQKILLSTIAASGNASNTLFISSHKISPNSSPNLILHSLYLNIYNYF